MQQKKIFMVVDEGADVVSGMVDTLKGAYDGCVVYTASEGREALAKMRNVRPHLLITDVELPKTSGADLIRSIMSDKSLARVAVIAVSDIPDTEVSDIEWGNLERLVRPFEPAQLLDAVSRALFRVENPGGVDFKVRKVNAGDTLWWIETKKAGSIVSSLMESEAPEVLPAKSRN